MKDKIYKPNEFAKLLGVSVRCLQRWDNDGKLTAFRSPTNRRFYTHTQYLNYMGIGDTSNNVNSRKIVIYARVSSRSQKDDLNNQIEFLKTFANAKGLIVDNIISDIASGLNFNRKNWNQLLLDCQENKIKTIIIAHKDRFVRFGFDWFSNYLKSLGVNIIIVNNDKLSPEEELVQDLISIIHVFSDRIYGLRKYNKEIKLDKELDVKNI